MWRRSHEFATEQMPRYDQFHDQKDRVVRISTDYNDNQNQVRLATSSFAVAQEIRDNVPEAEFVTTVGHGFDGDFRFENNGHHHSPLRNSLAICRHSISNLTLTSSQESSGSRVIVPK